MLDPTPDRSPHSTIRLRVRYAETDRMGVVYHPNYLVWCEAGRTELMRERLGMSYADLERSGTLLAVAEATARYRRAARYDDEVEVATWLTEARSRSVTFQYEIFRVDGGSRAATLATAATRLVSIGTDHRPKRLERGLLERFRGIAGGR